MAIKALCFLWNVAMSATAIGCTMMSAVACVTEPSYIFPSALSRHILLVALVTLGVPVAIWIHSLRDARRRFIAMMYLQLLAIAAMVAAMFVIGPK
jgi:hypothetical protein